MSEINSYNPLNNVNNIPLTSSDAPVLNPTAGIFGAVIGACIGAVAWVLVGMVGYVSAWISVLMIFLAMTGYKKMAGGIDKTGKITATIVAMIAILPADFIVYCMSAIKVAAKDGYNATFSQAASIIISDLFSSESSSRGEFLLFLFQGYIFALLGVYFYHLYSRKNTIEKTTCVRMLRGSKLSAALKYVIAFLCLFIGTVLMVIFTSDDNSWGILAMSVSFILFLYFIVNAQVPFIRMDDNGFTYNDGNKHRLTKPLAWSKVVSVSGPTPDNKFCQITTDDSVLYLMDGSKIEHFEEFWNRVNNLNPSVPQ